MPPEAVVDFFFSGPKTGLEAFSFDLPAVEDVDLVPPAFSFFELKGPAGNDDGLDEFSEFRYGRGLAERYRRQKEKAGGGKHVLPRIGRSSWSGVYCFVGEHGWQIEAGQRERHCGKRMR